MKVSRTTALFLSFALPVLAFAQEFKTFQEAEKAFNQAIHAKDFAKAASIAPAAKKLTTRNWQRDQIDARLLQGCERANDYTNLTAYGLPLVTGCTNFSVASGTIRTACRQVAKAAIATGDLATFRKILDQLAKEEVTDENFTCWDSVARVLVDDALEQRKKPAKEKEELVAGFREGSSTFGLWQVPLVIDGRLAIDRLRLDEAVNILTKVMPQGKLSEELRYRRDLALLDAQVRVGEEKGRLEAFRPIHAFLFSYEPSDRDGTNLLDKAIDRAFTFHRERDEWMDSANLAKELAAKRKDFLGGKADAMLGRELAYRYLAGEDASYQKALAAFTKMPMTPGVFNGYMEASDIMWRDPYSGRDTVAIFLEPLYKIRARLNPDQRFRLLDKLFNCANRAQDVKKLKAVFSEMRALAKEREDEIKADDEAWKEARAKKQPYTRKGLRRMPLWAGAYRTYAQAVFYEHDNAEAIEAFKNLCAEQPKHADNWICLATAQLFAGQKKECVESLKDIVTNTACRADWRFSALVIQAAAQARDAKDFTKRVKKAFFGKDDTENFNLLRAASARLFEAGANQRQIDYLLALQEIGEEMKHPEVRATYSIGYLADAPRTAEGALRSGLFEKLPKGDVFFPYATYTSINKQKEIALLKSKPEPELTKYEQGKEGFLVMAYDTTGVHLYIRLNDPDACKTLAGLNNGAGFEISIMPGDMTEYHQVFGNARDPVDRNEIEWDSPQKGRKLSRDYVRTDSAVAKDGYVFHTFIPWLACYTRMPAKDDIWRYVIGCSWAGQFRMAGGGSVHEFGRGLQVRFKDAPAERADVRRGMVEQAVGEYQRIRGEWSTASFWADPHMGDPAFHEKVVKPFLADLDAQAKIVTGGKADEKEIGRLYKDYLGKWIDFRLHVDDLRVKTLRERFFTE